MVTVLKTTSSNQQPASNQALGSLRKPQIVRTLMCLDVMESFQARPFPKMSKLAVLLANPASSEPPNLSGPYLPPFCQPQVIPPGREKQKKRSDQK